MGTNLRRCKLGDLLEIKRGASLAGSYYSDNGSLVRLTLGNFDYPNGGFKANKSKSNIYYLGKVRDEFVLHKGDLITPLTEQTYGLLGEVAIIPEDNKYIQSGDIGLIIPYEDVLDRDFAYYLISSSIVKKQLSACAQQTKIRHTSPDKIKECVVFIPELDEQRKIGTFLKAIDEEIRINNVINDMLQKQMKTIYDYWFIQYDFPDEKGNPYRSSGGEMVWNEQLRRDIPKDWEVKSLAQLMKKNGRTFDFSSEQPTIDLSVMPSDSVVLSRFNSSSNFNTNLYMMKYGDILFGSIRPYLHKAGFAPCDGVVAGTVHSFHVLNASDYNFVLFTICQNTFFNYAVNSSTGTKMPVVSSDAILDYKIAYSPAIVKKFNEVSFIDIVSTKVQENIQLKNLRDWIIPILMNGQATIMD